MPLYRGEPAMRRARASELRAAGQSLRQIAAALRVSHQTVANDLARADLDRANVTHLPLSSSAVNFRPEKARKLTGEVDSPTATVTPLRRSS